MTGPRVISFLGTGTYQPADYSWDGRRAAKTKYMARVLAELVNPASLTVLATEEARNKHGESLAAELSAAGLVSPRFVSIPSGSTPPEQWRLFDTVADVLQHDEPVVLDITHGYRSLPFFAGAVVAFLRAVDRAPADIRIVYGAFEAPGDVKPIWDLTAVLEVADWGQALRMFLRTGNPGGVHKPLERLGKELRRRWSAAGRQPPEPQIQSFAKAIQAFGLNLATVRIPMLLQGGEGSGTHLAAATEAARHDIQKELPPMARVLDDILAMARRLPAASTLGGPPAASFVNLAQLYLDLQRYPEGLIAIREGWISLYGAGSLDRNVREQTEILLYNKNKHWRTVADFRNDVEHGGMNPQPKPARTIIENLPELIDQFRLEAELGGPPLAPKTAFGGAVFANLSNHPSADWPSEQLDAARSYAPTIVDVLLDPVPPDADVAQVEQIAHRIAGDRVPPETTHAMVMGEFTLTHCLVRLLQRRRVVCLAATTERNVRQTSQGEKLSVFRFVRFREYPA